MKSSLVRVQAIKIHDDTHFEITWTDHCKSLLKLAQLQANCPCANCNELRLAGKAVRLDPDVRATSIKSVGRYALRVSFESGCCAGIYTYEQLRALSLEEL